MTDEIWKERFTQAGRDDAWHKKGTHFDSADKDLTLADVIKKAGADYEVVVKPLTIDIEVPDFGDAGETTIDPNNQLAALSTKSTSKKGRKTAAQSTTKTPAPQRTKIIKLETGQNALVRMPHEWQGATDGAKVLGTCSDRFVPIQNATIAQAFEQVAKVYRPETCGVLKDGEIFFLTLNAGMFDIRVNGHDDQHNAYIYIFDRKTPGAVLLIGAGSTRVVCYNTMRGAEANARILIPFQHDASLHALVDAVAKALLGVQSAQKALRDALQQMASHKMTKRTAEDTFKIAWPDPKLSQTILSLDTISNPVDSPNQSQIDQIATAMNKVNAEKVLRDKIEQAQKDHAVHIERMEYFRETAMASLMHMAEDEKLGINGYTVLNAVSETLEHRTGRLRGDVATDTLIGERARIMDTVSGHLLKLSAN